MRVSRMLVLAVVLAIALLAVAVVADRSENAPGSRVKGDFKDKDGEFQLSDRDQPNRFLRVKFKSLEEVDPSGKKVQGTKGFGGSWAFSPVVATTLQGYSCRAVNLTAAIRPQNTDTLANIRTTFYFFDQNVTLTDGNSTNIVRVRLGELKFTIHIDSWPFENSANTLQLLAVVKTNDDGSSNDDDAAVSSSTGSAAPAPASAARSSSSSTGSAQPAVMNLDDNTEPRGPTAHEGQEHEEPKGGAAGDDKNKQLPNKGKPLPKPKTEMRPFGKSGKMALTSVTAAWVDGAYVSINATTYNKQNEFGVIYSFPYFTQQVEFDPVATINAESTDSGSDAGGDAGGDAGAGAGAGLTGSATAVASSSSMLVMFFAAIVAMVARA